MHGQRILAWLVVLPFYLLSGCILVMLAAPPSLPPPRTAFLHMAHRQNYSLTAQELRDLQLYISTTVLAQYEGATEKKSVLVSAGTPGVVTDVGPDWLKVSFREGGIDVPFIIDRTDRSRKDIRYFRATKEGLVEDKGSKDSQYWLATEVEGRKGFYMIKELPEKVFLYEGTRYSLVTGARAYLKVDPEGLNKLVKSRKATEGRQVSDE